MIVTPARECVHVVHQSGASLAFDQRGHTVYNCPWTRNGASTYSDVPGRRDLASQPRSRALYPYMVYLPPWIFSARICVLC
jgi:hypothetical protein